MLDSRSTSRSVDGILTEIVLQAYADRILVLITQMGKVGNLVQFSHYYDGSIPVANQPKIQASIPATTPLLPALGPDPAQPNVRPLPPPPAAIQLTPLLGNAPSEHIQTLHSLYTAQIATIIWTAESAGAMEIDRRNVVVGIALRKSDGDADEGLSEKERMVFLDVMDMLRELLANA